jgi:putative thioredoxin
MNRFIAEANAENFETLILGNSARGLVLANFWSPRAGPCMLLMPRLNQLAEAYGGRFLLVHVNTDELGQRARRMGVTSVPTVKFFLRGEVAHTIHGAESDAVFHAALGRFLADEREAPRQSALRLHQAGRSEEAIERLARQAVDEPENLAVAADLAKLLTLAGRTGEALALLAALPAPARAAADIAPLLAHLQLIEAAGMAIDATEAAPSPATLLTLAARALFEDDHETALRHLLEIAGQAPDYRDDIGRRAMLALFAMLGPEHELTRRYRARLAELSV